MSTRSTAAVSEDPGSSEDVFDLTPEEDAELRQALAEADEDERQGRLIPADVFLAHLRRKG